MIPIIKDETELISITLPDLIQIYNINIIIQIASKDNNIIKYSEYKNGNHLSNKLNVIRNSVIRNTSPSKINKCNQK